MISLVLSVIILLLGYVFYGSFVEKVFAPDERGTPVATSFDGVDFVPMKTWRAYLVQLLNIAGTGPIFGALMGAVFGPVVFLWIVIGSIFGGAVHDYMMGMLSCRHNGASVAEIAGIYFGTFMKWLIRVFSVVLLVLVGTVFVTSPAALLAVLTPEVVGKNFWVVVILLYYLLATLLPIDKVIGKIYPFFGILLGIMAVGIMGSLLLEGYNIPEVTLANLHPDALPVWPFMFITVACGAISGFHATQSPLIAKCIVHEKEGRRVFYGAMITEAMIALIWAAAGVAFYGATGGLQAALSSLGQSGVVYEISTDLMGTVGGILAVIGIIICPISSGDTAFRSARLILAEWLKIDQSAIRNRIAITLPLIGLGALLTQIDFNVLWRYFSWSNQTLAMIVLWCVSVYLVKGSAYRWGYLVTTLPAAFMSAVTLTYILMAEEGLGLAAPVSCLLGLIFAGLCLGFFILKYVKQKELHL